MAIFFSPKDLVYETIKLVPIYATICTLKEILRAKKVYKGLAEGRDAMPHNGSLLFIPVLIATLKGKAKYNWLSCSYHIRDISYGHLKKSGFFF